MACFSYVRRFDRFSIRYTAKLVKPYLRTISERHKSISEIAYVFARTGYTFHLMPAEQDDIYKIDCPGVLQEGT
jgi:hypothetical protein